MDNQTVVYPSQMILAILQGPTLLQVLGDHAELRRTIIALDKLTEFLVENERRIYPDLAPLPGKSRPFPSVQGSQSDVKHRRILSFIEKWLKRNRCAPNMRDIRNFNRGWPYEDLAQTVRDMVQIGKLREIPSGKTTRYTLPLGGNE